MPWFVCLCIDWNWHLKIIDLHLPDLVQFIICFFEINQSTSKPIHVVDSHWICIDVVFIHWMGVIKRCTPKSDVPQVSHGKNGKLLGIIRDRVRVRVRVDGLVGCQIYWGGTDRWLSMNTVLVQETGFVTKEVLRTQLCFWICYASFHKVSIPLISTFCYLK